MVQPITGFTSFDKSVATGLGRSAVPMTPVTGLVVTVIANLAGIENSVATEFQPATRAAAISCDRIAVIALFSHVEHVVAAGLFFAGVAAAVSRNGVAVVALLAVPGVYHAIATLSCEACALEAPASRHGY